MSNEPSGKKLPLQILPAGGVDSAGICLRCGKHVALDKAVVLEQDGRIAEWHDFGVPENDSQGPALFGDVCAKHMRVRARFELGTLQDEELPHSSYLAKMSHRLAAMINETKSPAARDHLEFMLKVVRYQLTERS